MTLRELLDYIKGDFKEGSLEVMAFLQDGYDKLYNEQYLELTIVQIVATFFLWIYPEEYSQ